MDGEKDGSIEDESGGVIFFSAKRSWTTSAWVIAALFVVRSPDQNLFNNEHILPEWLLRRYDIFPRTIKLPNEVLVRYDRYTIPCCVECNDLMGVR